MRPRLALPLLLLSSAMPLAAQSTAQVPPKPKLIVAIAVDQLSSDVFTEYRAHFTGGFKRLAQGVVFPRGHQSHAATETCPGHSTILTGSRPARTGIIANDWQDPANPRKTKDGKLSYDVYCVEAPRTAASDFMTGSGYVVSSQFLKVPTLGDRMKAVDPATKVVSVSQKDRAAVMMGGHKADLTLWFDGKGGYTTYPASPSRLPATLPALNAAIAKEIAADAKPALPAACKRYVRPIAMSEKVTLATLPIRKGGNPRAWLASGQSDAATMRVALAAMQDYKLGRGASTDVLAISFSASDYVGHSTGTEGPEMCAQMFALDGVLGKLFASLDKSGVPYAVSLTADHGGHDMPERNRMQALPAAQRVDVQLSAAIVGAKLQRAHGLSGPALIGRSPFGDMYLSRDIPAADRDKILAEAISVYTAHPQVEAVLTRRQIMDTPAPTRPVDEWTLAERAKASFDPERSGDFIVLLKPYVTPIPDGSMGYYATHGSPWGYDRRVPILFWWKGMTGFEQPNAVETVDIMPTWASLIGLPVPASEIDGRCLDLMAGQPDNCAR